MHDKFVVDIRKRYSVWAVAGDGTHFGEVRFHSADPWRARGFIDDEKWAPSVVSQQLFAMGYKYQIECTTVTHYFDGTESTEVKAVEE